MNKDVPEKGNAEDKVGSDEKPTFELWHPSTHTRSPRAPDPFDAEMFPMWSPP